MMISVSISQIHSAFGYRENASATAGILDQVWVYCKYVSIYEECTIVSI